ncbi:ABC transporter permease [Paenibacillus macerans]|uniref:ABC transporter permease n=1 Tax=Paenibacillus macerans TaxID=44252 RepID=UPI0022DFB553|nr:ABC transporter permease [Paenibacillus macerans]
MSTVKSLLTRPISLVIFLVFLLHLLMLVKNPGDNFYNPWLYSEELVERFGPGIVEYGSYDATFYAKSAEQLMDKGFIGYNSDKPNAYVTPGQPIYLAFTFMVADILHLKHSLMAKIFNMVLSVGTVYIMYLICKELFNKRKIGLLAALALGLYFPVFHYFRTLLTETPSMFFFYLSVYLVIKAIKSNERKYHILFGIIFSISLMIRPNQATLVLLPIALVLKKYGVKESIKIGLLWIIGPLLIILPWVVRNAIQFHEFILFSTQSNPLLAGSNPFFLEDYSSIYQNVLNSGLTESEYAIKKIVEGYKANPILWICWFIFGKTMYLFNQPSAWGNYSNYSYLTGWIKLYHFSIIVIGAGTAFFAKNKKVRYILYCILIYIFTSNIFLPNDRYGYFIYPFFIILCCYGVNFLIDGRTNKNNKSEITERTENDKHIDSKQLPILFEYFRDILKQRYIIFELAKKDFKLRYLGSSLGVFWAFIQPSLLVLIYWFVFQVGFRNTPVENFPFILWLLAGIVPWFYFSDSLGSVTNSIEQNSYLVKKIVFKVHFLPIVKIVSSLMVHLVFIMLMLLIYYFYGLPFEVYHLQIFYYSFAVSMFLVGLSWVVSSLNVFLKDIGQIVSIILQFGFWLTPVFWTFKLVPEKLHWLFKLNPIYYVVEGYRDSLINRTWFWQHANLTIYFWTLTILLLFTGAKLFKKISPHFSDVL